MSYAQRSTIKFTIGRIWADWRKEDQARYRLDLDRWTCTRRGVWTEQISHGMDLDSSAYVKSEPTESGRSFARTDLRIHQERIQAPSWLSSKKDSAIAALQESVTKTSWTDSLHRQESAISHGNRSSQTETVGAHPWENPVASSRRRGIKPQKKEAGSRVSSIPIMLIIPFLPLSKGCRVCASRIGLYNGRRVCKNRLSTAPKTSSARNQPFITWRYTQAVKLATTH